jgi:alpha-L-fucosidase
MTSHSVASSPWRGGRGDLVREFVDACRADGLKPGLYLSPWDRHEPRYGDSPRYNDFYCDQLTELLTQYGEIHEVWFDGANGEGPNGKKQEYDWPRVWNLVRRLQPNAVMFSDAGPDVRWIGNERGIAGDPNWSTVDPGVVPVPGASGRAVRAMLQNGDPAGSAWRPGEADVSIRPGWFNHPAEDARVKTVDALVDLYFSSVGRNAKLLLNVPPTRDGLLHETDVTRLAGMRAAIDRMLSENLAAHRDARWQVTGNRTATLDVALGAPAAVGLVDLREDITRGQVIARYTIEGRTDGEWQTLAQGTTIGCRKLDRCEPVTSRHIRVTIADAVDVPRPIELGVYRRA